MYLNFQIKMIVSLLVGFTAVGAARGPVELEDLDWKNVVAEN